MRRLFYAGKLAQTILISGQDAYHITRVLRGKLGQEVMVVDDENQAARMRLAAFGPKAVTLELIEKLPLQAESSAHITLAQCVLKGEKMELVLQKATELGVKRFIPIIAENCVPQYDEEKQREKAERWQRIADEAAKQCGRNSLMNVMPPIKIDEFLGGIAPEKTLIFCYENETRRPMGEVLRSLADQQFVLLIGPEGGFTQSEAAAVESKGGISVTLGPRILRAETAAIAAVAILQHDRGDLG